MAKKKDKIVNKIKSVFKIKKKEKTYSLLTVCIVGFLCGTFGLVFGLLMTYGKDTVTGKKISPELQSFMNTYEEIVENYYGKIDENELVNAALDGMMNKLDIHSQYFNEESSKSFNEDIEGNYVGIGVTVKYNGETNSVVEVKKGSPAEKAGVKVGDQILKVDGKEITAATLVNSIQGKEGTKVKITFLRDDKEITLTIERKKIEIDTVTSKIVDQNNKKIGVVTISSFSANTYKQLNSALKKLEKKNISGLVIDLRDNNGGQLTQANSILNLFFKKGTVLFKIKGKDNTTTFKDTTKEKRTYPIAVVVNNSSASASEVVASCFKDNYKNGYIVGVTTYGKGTVQQVKKLSNGTTIKYTSQKWLTSKGKSIDGKGVKPDYEVILDENSSKDNDPQINKALELVSK